MAPVALHPHDNGLSRNANGKNTSTVTSTATAAPPAEPRAQPKSALPVHRSSADVIRLEHEFGAHKYGTLFLRLHVLVTNCSVSYHPLPVVFDHALGAK